MIEEKPEIRYLFNRPIPNCDECPRIWKSFHTEGNHLCTAMGFSVENLSVIHRRCPLPKRPI